MSLRPPVRPSDDAKADATVRASHLMNQALSALDEIEGLTDVKAKLQSAIDALSDRPAATAGGGDQARRFDGEDPGRIPASETPFR